MRFDWLATPLWVDLLFFVPVLVWFYFRKTKLSLTNHELLLTAIFGIAFGFIESACVIYLRASADLLPGFKGTLADVQKHAFELYNQQLLPSELP